MKLSFMSGIGMSWIGLTILVISVLGGLRQLPASVTRIREDVGSGTLLL
jgi:hypothetical protein